MSRPVYAKLLSQALPWFKLKSEYVFLSYKRILLTFKPKNGIIIFIFVVITFVIPICAHQKSFEFTTLHEGSRGSHDPLFLQRRSQGPFSLNFISTKMTINFPQAGVGRRLEKGELRGHMYWPHVHTKKTLLIGELLKGAV